MSRSASLRTPSECARIGVSLRSIQDGFRLADIAGFAFHDESVAAGDIVRRSQGRLGRQLKEDPGAYPVELRRLEMAYRQSRP